jgi:hypothetical protein
LMCDFCLSFCSVVILNLTKKQHKNAWHPSPKKNIKYINSYIARYVLRWMLWLPKHLNHGVWCPPRDKTSDSITQLAHLPFQAWAYHINVMRKFGLFERCYGFIIT